MNLPVSRCLTALASVLVISSCATSSDPKSKEALVIAADFKVIKPVKPDQKKILEELSANKLTRITYKGQSYYVLPDREDGQAYVGGTKQYQAYQQLSRAKNMATEATNGVTEYDKDKAAVANWNDWGGWDGWADGNDWSSNDGQTN